MDLNSKDYAFAGFNNAGQSVYRESAGGVPTSFSYLTNKVTTRGAKANSEDRWHLSVPHVADSASACACEGDITGTDYVRIDVSLSPTTSATQRTDILMRIQDLVLTSQFVNSVTGLIQPSA